MASPTSGNNGVAPTDGMTTVVCANTQQTRAAEHGEEVETPAPVDTTGKALSEDDTGAEEPSSTSTARARDSAVAELREQKGEDDLQSKKKTMEVEKRRPL